MSDEWLTVREVAARLGVTRQFVYDTCASLELQHTRVGKGIGKIRIRAAWLDAWIEARTVSA